MRRVTWLTDIHLDFVAPGRRTQLVADIRAERPDLVLIGGDIGEAATFASYLESLASDLDCPIAFVLGNHDYYGGSIANVRARARELTQTSDRLSWLPEAGLLALTDDVGLVGHGGWGDARCGEFLGSNVVLNDYLLISEIRTPELSQAVDRGSAPDISDIISPTLQHRLQQLGDEAAAHLRSTLTEALERHRQVIVLTHVPPFREACWYEGRTADDNWAPHFVCQAAGQALQGIMHACPDRELLVLCGHTHGAGEAQILPNLRVLTGGAVYREPAVQQTFEF